MVPADVTQQTDTDGDGYGDNADGISGDLFPNNPEQHEDSDVMVMVTINSGWMVTYSPIIVSNGLTRTVTATVIIQTV